ncbi:sulfatase family protein [Thalassoroseus pseudoceratinae]|uniref:sulfatase family protein n=1 Tax=Thalassoroseus pseudoceratinae TaxID=2713176 RepID=UPI001424814A|nr:sulfatase [Thalassoroseus pseudoceratinae]
MKNNHNSAPLIHTLVWFAATCSSLSGGRAASAADALGVVPVPESVQIELLPDAKPRNVVFILSDDHRYDAMSFLGHPIAETPRMDAMARDGVHLKNAYVTTSLCSPSRASILTGLYTFRHRVIDNQRAVPDGTLFFPQYLQKAGYRTGFVGKWHMGGGSDQPRPGFDYWVSFKGQGHYLPPNPKYTLNVNGQRVKQKGYITTELTDYAIDFLKQQQDSDTPFFLYLSHKAVHGNFVPEQKYKGKFADKPFNLPANANPVGKNTLNRPRWVLDQRNSWHGMDFPLHTVDSIEEIYKWYCEALCSVDDSIGVVMDQLKAMGIHDETLVIYMGDNGYMFGEHGLIDKRVAYETSSRVPMLMQCPDLLKAGTVVDEVVANIDVGPTIMEAMGLRKPPHMDGRSFLPLAEHVGTADSQSQKIADAASTTWRDYFLYVYYWEPNFPMTPTHFSLRGDRYKYITYYGLWDTDELFDIKADPHEQNNLIHDPKFADQRDKMQSRLYQMMEELGGMHIPMNAPRGRQHNKRLRSRGVHDRSGEKAADFPEAMIVEEALRTILND